MKSRSSCRCLCAAYCLRYYPAPVMRAGGWLFYERREMDECQLAHEYIIAPRNIHFWMATKPTCRLGLRQTTSRRCQSVVTSKRFLIPSSRLSSASNLA
jgi:hypothetical protein